MNYKIGEFCRLLGVSPDTLRYYERRRLISTHKNPENQYRTFTKQNALDIWNLQMLRSLDMGLKDIDALHGQDTFEEQARWLHDREKALAEEIERLQMKRKRFTQLSLLYDAAKNVNQVEFQPAMHANYAVYIMGDSEPVKEDILHEMPRWIDCLPFTYFAVGIPLQSMMDDTPSLHIRLGLGILEENVEKAGIPIPAHTEYMPACPCIQIALRTNDIFSLTKLDMAPLYAYAKASKLCLCGPAAGRIICSTHKASKNEYIVGLSVPVQSQPNIP